VSRARLVDLSHRIDDGMITYPGLPGPRIDAHLSFDASRAVYTAGTEFQIGRIEMVGNTGTYIDSPQHRYRDGTGLADIALEQVAGLPGIAIDDEGPVIQPDPRLTADLAGHAVLFHTGWSRHWRTERYGHPDHPYLSGATVDALLDARPALVGIDSVNIDDTRGGERDAHTRLLEAGILIVEHLTGLAALPEHGFEFFAVPAKVDGIGTFPIRAFAVLRDEVG
jgi:arylformamidase